MKPDALKKARSLYYSQHYGVLGTISVKLEGFPFGSVVPYCLDGQGRPVVLISTIAQHTKNVSQDSRCSLTITPGRGDVQAKARICVVGNMVKLPEEEEAVRERYYQYFPQSRSYNQAHDFSFYRLEPVSVRYIGGFGAIYWVEPEVFFQANPFFGKGEDRIVSHINEDHRHNLCAYMGHYKGVTVGDKDKIRMAGINEQGFDVFVGEDKYWFEFDMPISTPVEAREALVAMAKAVK